MGTAPLPNTAGAIEHLFDSVGDMTDRVPPHPHTSEDWELIRRSVAMLPPGAWAMRREPALEALAALVAGLRDERRNRTQSS